MNIFSGSAEGRDSPNRCGLRWNLLRRSDWGGNFLDWPEMRQRWPGICQVRGRPKLAQIGTSTEAGPSLAAFCLSMCEARSGRIINPVPTRDSFERWVGKRAGGRAAEQRLCLRRVFNHLMTSTVMALASHAQISVWHLSSQLHFSKW